MKRKRRLGEFFLGIFFSAFLILGACATSPPKERMKLPPREKEAAEPKPPIREPLREIILPQREEVKKIPEKRFSLSAREANVQDVLLAFSRESEMNIIIDPELKGKVTVDLKGVTITEALEAVLSPLGWTFQFADNFIRIQRVKMESRLFTLNYIATKRSGKREIYASTGGGLQTAAAPGTQTSVTPGSSRTGYSDLVSVDEVDMWKEIQKGLETIIFGAPEEKEEPPETGKGVWTRVDSQGKKLIVHRSSGIIWVTDYPANLNRVAAFLEKIEGSSQRQVTIQAKIMEVILSDEHREGINWKVIQGLPRALNLAWGLTDQTGTIGYPGGPLGYLSESGPATVAAPGGSFRVNPLGGIFAIGAAAGEVVLADIISAIAEQGDVKVLSSPTISTLNNQKAIIRVGNQDVFFITGAVATQTTVTQIIQPMTIDIGIILDVTPQISEDGTIIMNIHPSITEKTGEKVTPDGKTTFPLLSVRETDTTVRVKDGQTIIIAGLMQEKKEEAYIGIPGLQSIPLLGALFRYKTERKRNAELVIMITPTIQVGKKAEDLTRQ
ncbi:MAG: secretin and TonB N-terminal domain-containing protein [Thermodesulfobacteriota bacterium]